MTILHQLHQESLLGEPPLRLDEIIAHKRQELNQIKAQIPLEFYQVEPSEPRLIHSLRKKLVSDNNFHFICEIKKASPSRGILQKNFNPIKQAHQYHDAGAAAISILTDEKYFMGKLEHLQAIREIVDLPLLRKDFIIDSYQIYESRFYGADLILLIARILTKKQVTNFTNLAAILGLEVLLELADEADLTKIPSANHNIILGVNNRNLETFEVNLENSLKLKPHLPNNIPVISESGIATAADCLLLYQHGFAGALIGESLMRASSPEILLDEFRKGIANAG
jgi:indole-3-glycerol phosphate synthase